MKNDIIPQSINIVAEQPQTVTDIVLQRKVKNFKNQKEVYFYLTHELDNNKQIDGRINFGQNSTGQTLANSVSPYSKTFNNNIEEKIKDLVCALKKKRYLTYSSCQGHCLYSRRFVGLAFPSEEEREQFINACKTNFFIRKFITFNSINSVANIEINFDEYNSPTPKDKISQDTIRNEEFLDGEAEYFNVSFHRSYHRYYFLEVIILNQLPLPHEKNSKTIKNLYIKFLKKYFWDFLTKKLTIHIENKQFPKFKF